MFCNTDLRLFCIYFVQTQPNSISLYLLTKIHIKLPRGVKSNSTNLNFYLATNEELSLILFIL